jgi:MFS family permease
MSSSGRERLVSREFVIVAIATVLYFLGLGAVNPLMPQFVVDELGGSEFVAGLVMGVFAVSALVTRSWFGRMGDRRGARRLIVLGCLLAAVSMLVLLVTTTVALAIVARLVLGAAQAAVITGSTALAIDLAPVSRRGEAASYILVAFHLGLGLGPVGAEVLRDAMSYDAVWVIVGGLALLGAAVAMLLPVRRGDPSAAPSPWIHPSGIAPGLVAAFGLVAFVAFTTFVPLYSREIGLEKVGTVFMVASISIAVARIAFARVPDLLGPIRTGTIALSVTILGALTLALWNTIPGVYASAVVLAAGLSLQTPSMIAVAVHGVADNQRTSAIATFTMFMDLSVAVTGPLIGLIVSGTSYRIAFLTAVCTTVVALLVLYRNLAPRWRASTSAVVVAA